MLKNRPLVFAKPVEVETAVEEVLVLGLVETLDEEVVEEVALAEEEVVLATELVDLDVDVVVAGAAPEHVRNGVQSSRKILTWDALIIVWIIRCACVSSNTTCGSCIGCPTTLSVRGLLAIGKISKQEKAGYERLHDVDSGRSKGRSLRSTGYTY
jgi:hypothetical protein